MSRQQGSRPSRLRGRRGEAEERHRYRMTLIVAILTLLVGIPGALGALGWLDPSSGSSNQGQSAASSSSHTAATTTPTPSATSLGTTFPLGCPSAAEPGNVTTVVVQVVKWCAAPAVREEVEVKVRLCVKNVSHSPEDIGVGHWWMLVAGTHLGTWTQPELGPQTSLRPKQVQYDGQAVWAIPANLPHSYDDMGGGLYTFTSYWSASSLSANGTFPPTKPNPDEAPRDGDLVLLRARRFVLSFTAYYRCRLLEW